MGPGFESLRVYELFEIDNRKVVNLFLYSKVKYYEIGAIVCYKKLNFADIIFLRQIIVVTIDDVQRLLETGNLQGALIEVTKLIAQQGDDDKLYYLQGKIHLRNGEWQAATNAFLHAQELNPDSPAKEQLAMIKDIMNFYNKDMYNH